MTTIEVVVPIITVEEMQAIWDAQPESTLTLIDHETKQAWDKPLHIARMPRRRGEVVTSKPVLFTFDADASPSGWQALLFGREFLAGSFKLTNVIPGDSIQCTLAVRGGR